MIDNLYLQQNGRGQAAPSNGYAPGTMSQMRKLRVPTVNEALPYSPFSSIVPFNPDLISPPLSMPSTTPSDFHDFDKVKTAQRELELLSTGAQSAEDASKRCQQTLDDVKRLLDAETLTQFKFKATKRLSKGPPAQTAPVQPKLSSFAKMVYDNTEVQYRYLTPESPLSEEKLVAKSSQQTDRQALQHNKQTARQTPLQPKVAKPNDQAPPERKLARPAPQPKLAQFAPIQISPRPSTGPPEYNGSGSSQQGADTSSQGTSQAFVKPAQLTPAQRAEYQKVRDISPSKTQGAVLQSRALTADQRHKSDVAVKELQDLLADIFEEEDRMQPDTSGEAASYQSRLFSTRDHNDQAPSTLQNEYQVKLDTAVMAVANAGRLDDIDVEHWVRVERLCESSLNTLQTVSLHVGNDWTEQDVQEWVGRITATQSGLVASRTLMRIMTAGSHRKELQSEDFLQAVLDGLRTVVETGIMPLIELRPSDKAKGEKNGERNPHFDIASDYRALVKTLLHATSRSLKLVGDLFVKTDVDESEISSVEYLCRTLIFAGNAAVERDSACGIQAFEKVRLSAMDVIARIFTKHTSQRNPILNEILLSLEKLPATKQSARQFPVPNVKPIQLVSALFMRLVQASATVSARSNDVGDEDDEQSEIDNSEEIDAKDSDDEIQVARKKNSSVAMSKKQPTDLRSLYKPLIGSARANASFIVRNLVERALSTSKASDEPFRRLLDIFTEDFLNVLGTTDYPAAELILRVLVSQLLDIADSPKKPAPARTLALELIGIIGCGILDTQTSAARAGEGHDAEDAVARQLAELARQSESGNLDYTHLTAADGPYRVLVEYIDARDTNGNDLGLQSACAYHLVQWAELVCEARDGSTDDGSSTFKAAKNLQSQLHTMISDEHWLAENALFKNLTTPQGKLAGRVVAANSRLCRAFGRMFTTVLASMNSEQPTVRSRSLKSVTTLLEKDPTVLDRHQTIMAQIVRLFSDPSSLVRDSALLLTQKCVALRPALELKIYDKVIPRTNDSSVGVRKRAMAFLKEVYLRHNNNKIRAAISNALITRVNDADESVADVARSTIEEVWFSAFKNVKPEGANSVDALLKLRAHAALIIQTVELGDNVATVLEVLIKNLLTKAKQATETARVSKTFISALFDGVLDSNDIPGEPSKGAVLRTLNVFAKTAPGLFTASQLEHLAPYVQILTKDDVLDVYHNALMILRHTTPVVSGISPVKLNELTISLLNSLGRVPRSELAVMAPCLWTIHTVLGGQGQPQRLVKVVQSALKQMDDLRMKKTTISAENKILSKYSKLLTIIGQFGKACDFESELNYLKKTFTWYTGNSAAALLLDVVCHFTSSKQPLEIREAAIESICEICQAHPQHFLRTDVINAIETVFKDRIPSLEYVMLDSVQYFFTSGEESPESEALAAGAASGTQRLGGTYQAADYELASASLSQRFLSHFLRIALATSSDVALTAARIVVSINKRGMAHPGESGPSLVALQTCSIPAIAKLAFLAHREQYNKHEAVFEKGLVKAVQQAFEYQKAVTQDIDGYTGQPPTSKLHFFWDVLKTGKAKVRAKLFTQLCATLDFEPSKLSIDANACSSHLQFVRFCAENMAFFEYEAPADLTHLLSCLEKVFASTGTSLAQAIESEVMQLHIHIPTPQTVDNTSDVIVPAMDDSSQLQGFEPARLHRLAVSAQILSLLWETRTYLRKLWNAQKYLGKQKTTKKADKDDNKKEQKLAGRASNAPALTEAYQRAVDRIMDLPNESAAQRAKCTSFVELFSVDTEVKVGSDEDEDIMMEDDDDARSEGSSAKSPSAGPFRGKKRKSVDGGANGPPKKRARPRKSSMAKRDSDDEDGWV
ncbi:hypothetical protein DOTSEDRAFT_82361 [Dothistroma septosporum NZE10]|uniref:Sister chromatid cohesion protein n=1 Tax=Dothistroma septosporum (strain NZE10 / CBS 128990) TaxID=675120 RepID=N1PDZ4_DOTSN|nr:hypothetical protein DOTSEDRAFT_82361 [Dothistroma septosporum NZE10]